MSTLSRMSRGWNVSSTDDYQIYAPFCTKNATTGDTSTFIDCYTPSTNSWDRVTSIPGHGENLALKDFSMVSIDHYIYVIGGRLCRKSSEPNIGSGPEFNPRVVHACSDTTGQSTLGRAKGISSTEVYDPALDQWKSLANMSRMRYKSVGVIWQGKIHIVGGFVDGGEITGPFHMTRSSAEVYDVQRDKWDFIARMWDLDVPPYQIVAVNGKLFSSGDCFKRWKGHIEAYDEKENIWNEVHGSYFDCLSPTSRAEVTSSSCSAMMWPSYLTMAPIGNQLYFLVGYRIPGEGSRLRSEVHVFDTAAHGGGWRSCEPFEEEGEKELCGHCVVIKQEH
ncbi:UNVERIFIED_CONTAM: hypothetical protein Sradi_6426000 [Sesamum radiatum]|uniref:Kelch repeat-containing F-box family protein n=1 Tax=Sesamum radiatum TaxID=300843 RepID=A0AAW2K5M2_SESRA